MANSVKVAIVGSGLAGLTAAHLLSKVPKSDASHCEVHIFEKAPILGMDAHSVSLPTADGTKDWRVDVPMRSFQGYYPRLIAFYEQLGVLFHQSDFSYSFSVAAPTTARRHTIVTKMIYEGASGCNGVSVPSFVKAQYQQTKDTLPRLVLQVLACLICVDDVAIVHDMTFCECAQYSAPSGSLARLIGADVSWGEFLASVVIPLFSAVCTASEEDVLQHPVEEILYYVWLTFLTHHYIVDNGIRDVVMRLSACIENVHVSLRITVIEPDPSDARLISLHCVDAEGITRTYPGFSHIVFATQANHAVELLSSYHANLPENSPQAHFTQEQIQCLKAFTYQPTIVVNHTDESVLPDNSSDRRDLNLVCMSDSTPDRKLRVDDPDNVCVSLSYAMATHSLREPGTVGAQVRVVYQTTNPIIPPRKDSILSVARMERAVLTISAKKALRDLYVADAQSGKWSWRKPTTLSSGTLGRLQGMPIEQRSRPREGRPPGIWFCGSYAYQGLPLLEGCVVDAANVVDKGILA